MGRLPPGSGNFFCRRAASWRRQVALAEESLILPESRDLLVPLLLVPLVLVLSHSSEPQLRATSLADTSASFPGRLGLAPRRSLLGDQRLAPGLVRSGSDRLRVLRTELPLRLVRRMVAPPAADGERSADLWGCRWAEVREQWRPSSPFEVVGLRLPRSPR